MEHPPRGRRARRGSPRTGAGTHRRTTARPSPRGRAAEQAEPLRRGPAHRRREAPVRRRRRIAVGLAAFAIAATLVVAGGLMGTVSHLEGNLSTSPLHAGETPAPRESGGAMNVLLIGSDSRDLEDASYGEGDGSRRSDAMVLVHLSADDDRIDAVQLPRDTLMDLPACPDTGSGASKGGRGMLNSALNAGPACSVAAVEELTGVQIDHFMELDFEGFIAIVDALDGVPVCLPEPLEDPSADLDLPGGAQVVDGKDALALARTRHAVGDGSDIARLGHQQMVMSAVVQEATSSRVLSRPDRLYAFLDATSSALTVDPGLSRAADLAGLGTRASRVDPGHITFVTMPWEPAPTDHNRVVPSADAAPLFAALAADEPALPQAESPESGENPEQGRGSGSKGDSAPDGAAESDGSSEQDSAPEAGRADASDSPASEDGTGSRDSSAAGASPASSSTARTADTDLCAG
jgi:LCP family protein required for cell wall assembly